VTLQRHFDPASGGLLSAFIALAGIPGSLLGGTAPTAARTCLMLMLAAVGGFFIPIIFGHLVSHTGFGTGWVFLAIVSFTFALIGLAGRNRAGARAAGRDAHPARSAAGLSLEGLCLGA
jgi:hypothetical protein